MAATPSIKLTKSFTYRGVTRHFSNRYHFVGGTPPDFAHWHALAAAIILVEKACYSTGPVITGATGYAAGSEVPVYTETFSTGGTLSGTGSIDPPGDCAVCVRYSTTARTSKNHPVYLYNYYHGARLPVAGGDAVMGTQITAFNALASQWIGSGFSDGTTSYNRAGPNGATATGYLTQPLITHRDLPR